MEYSQTGVNTVALPDAAAGDQRQRVAPGLAGGVVADIDEGGPGGVRFLPAVRAAW